MSIKNSKHSPRESLSNDKSSITSDSRINGDEKEVLVLGSLTLFAVSVIFLSIFTQQVQSAIIVAGSCSVVYGISRTYFYRHFAHIVSTSLCFVSLIAEFIFLGKGAWVFHFAYLVPVIVAITHKSIKAYIPLFSFFILHHLLFSFTLKNESVFLFPKNTSAISVLVYYTTWIFVGLTVIFVARMYERETKAYSELRLKWEEFSAYFNKNILFAKEIASGRWDSEYEITAADQIGISLVEMRTSLKVTAEEDKNRNWAVEGIGRIEEILRLNNNNIDHLSFGVISTLVKYLGANQGAIFIHGKDEEGNKYLEMKGCYAYDKKKHLEKRIDVGQGLVGQAVLEKEIVLLTQIPPEYIHITSGLGEATPKCLVIIPLCNDDEIVGAIEIASFTEFKPFQVTFLRKVAGSISSAVITSKNNHRTTILLEESQQLTGKLQAQEEMMQQNVEELQAIQEELQRKNSEFEEFMEIFNEYAVRVELDLKGTITNVSSKYLDISGISKKDIVGKKFNAIIANGLSDSFDDAFWKQVLKSKVNEKDLPLKGKGNETIWLKGFFKPVEYIPGFARKVNLIGFTLNKDLVTRLESNNAMNE